MRHGITVGGTMLALVGGAVSAQDRKARAVTGWTWRRWASTSKSWIGNACSAELGAHSPGVRSDGHTVGVVPVRAAGRFGDTDGEGRCSGGLAAVHGTLGPAAALVGAELRVGLSGRPDFRALMASDL